MEHHLLGQACALLAAMTWAGAVVLFKRSGERIPPLGLNLYKTTVALVLLGATLMILVPLDPNHAFGPLREFGRGDFCLLMFSGIVGIAIADTLFFHALNLIGVGLVSIVDCTYSPAVLLFAWLILGEELTTVHYVGGGLILVGILIASRHKPPVDRTRGQLIVGMLLAVLAIVAMAVGVVIAKPVLVEMAIIWSTTIRMAGGGVFLVLFALLGKDKARNWAVFRPSPVWRFALPGAILGTYFAMVFWIGGFKYTYASVAAVLNQMSVIFAIILAAIFLREPFGGRKLAAVTLAMGGVILVTLSDWLFTDDNWKRLWPLAILIVVVPVVYQFKWGAQARRRLRRQQAGCCVECGFPLQGVEAARCPKCGTPISVDTLPTTEYP